MKKDKYTEHLLNSVLKSREISIRELSTMGENQIEHLESIENWYTSVMNWIRHNPPNYYVKYIEITEDKSSKISAINYVYFRRNEIVSAASIKVLIDF